MRLQKLRHPTPAGLALIGAVAAATALVHVSYAVRAVSLAGWVVASVLHALAVVSIWLLASAKLFPARPAVTWRNL